MSVLEGVRKEVRWPEDAVFGGPCLLRLAIQAVDEDNIYPCLGMSIHGGALKPRDLLVDGPLLAFNRTECQQKYSGQLISSAGAKLRPRITLEPERRRAGRAALAGSRAVTGAGQQ